MGRLNKLMCSGKALDFSSEDVSACKKIPRATSNRQKFVPWRLIRGTTAWNVMSPFWITAFWHGSWVSGKICLALKMPVSNLDRVIPPGRIHGRSFPLHHLGTALNSTSFLRWVTDRSQRPRGLMRGSAAAGSKPAGGMDVYCEFCVLWGFCDWLIPDTEYYYWVCVWSGTTIIPYTNNEYEDRGQTNKESRNWQHRQIGRKKKKRHPEENCEAESGPDVRTGVNISIRCELH